MTSTQKLIKYFALALAILLTVSIFSAILSGITGILYLLDDSDYDITEDMTEIFADQAVSSVEIDVYAARLLIQNGEKFSVSCNNKKIIAKIDGDTLEIEDKRNGRAIQKNDTTLIMTIPENMTFSHFSLEMGAGEIDIEYLTADIMELSIGAADFDANYLSAKKSVDAVLGAGDFTVLSGYLNMPDFELGVGKTEITATLDGNGEFDCGVGAFELVIYGSPSQYSIHPASGIGVCTVNGEIVSGGTAIGEGGNIIRISGGIGKVSVSFLQD